MSTTSQICPICETINPSQNVVCTSCKQDMRSSPLEDYLSFISNSVEGRKKDLIFQLGVLRHKIKLSFDVLKFLIQKNELPRIAKVYNYYISQIDRERRAVSYYIQLFSNRIYYLYNGLLILDTYVYFALLKSYLLRISRENPPASSKLRAEGLEILEDQKSKLIDTINDIIEDIEEIENREIYEYQWSCPPPLPGIEYFQFQEKKHGTNPPGEDYFHYG